MFEYLVSHKFELIIRIIGIIIFIYAADFTNNPKKRRVLLVLAILLIIFGSILGNFLEVLI